MKSPRELERTSKNMANEISTLVGQGRSDLAIQKFPEQEPVIRLLQRLHNGEIDEARTEFQKLSGTNSLDEAARLEKKVNIAHREALMLSRIGDFTGAEKAFDLALRLAPNFVTAYMNRGILYAKTGRKDLALRDFERAVHLAPQSDRARDYLAQAKAQNWSVFKV